MYLIRLAIKNLTRHKKRTLLTAGIIALAVVFYIFLDSLMLGMRNKALSNFFSKKKLFASFNNLSSFIIKVPLIYSPYLVVHLQSLIRDVLLLLTLFPQQTLTC